MARALTDQVCRRCKYVFDEDRFLDVSMPRVPGPGWRRKFFSTRSWPFLENLRSRPWIPPLASIVPGLGHVLQGKPWLGVLYCLLVTLFLWMSVTFFGQTYGQMLFGVAVSTHATCLLDTTPWGRSPEARPRIVGMAVVLTALMALYWPLVVVLARLFVAPERITVDRRAGNPIGVLSIDQLVIMGLIFLVSVAVSGWAGRRLSSQDY
jgi:hypothetical protein